MRTTAYASTVNVTEWVFLNDRTLHVSMSNLPLHEYHPGVTMCHLREEVSRCDRPPAYPQRGQVCRACIGELLAMGETLPGWMERLA